MRVSGAYKNARLEETYRSAVIITCDRLWKNGVDDAVGKAKIAILAPGDMARAVFRANLDVDVTLFGILRPHGFITHIGKVYGIVRADRHGGIAAVRLGGSVRYNVFNPGGAAIETHDQTSIAAAIPHRQVNRAIRADLDVAVNSTARIADIAGVRQHTRIVASP